MAVTWGLELNSEEQKTRMESRLAVLIPGTRIHAHIDVIVSSPERPVPEIMREHSRNATLVFLGLMDPGPGGEAEYVRRLTELTDGFPTTMFVRNTERSWVPVLLEAAAAEVGGGTPHRDELAALTPATREERPGS